MATKIKLKPWLYNGEPIDDDIAKDYEGFVYIMTHIPTGRKYIGKKSFWSKRKLKKEDKRRSRVESNWRNYFSSSNDIKDYAIKEGKEDWTREIIYLCKEMKYANYLEVKAQFVYGVLESDEWFNSNINGLWYSHWLNGIKESVDNY